MNIIDSLPSLRDEPLIRKLASLIQKEARPDKKYSFMEFCGGHTHAIFRYGLADLLPENVKMIHGPGCPVCVLSVHRIDIALALASLPDTIFCSYGDMLRVPGSGKKNLLQLKSEGADIRMVYSSLDSLAIAKKNPDREIIFFGIGFETTTPQSAVLIKQAMKENQKNISVVCNHVLTPAAIQHILNSPEVRELGTVKIDGFIGPGHVSAIIGSRSYDYFAEEFRSPVVITGFEPADILYAILLLIRQTNSGMATVENALNRYVSKEGNRTAQYLVADVFEMRKVFDWRGLGKIPYSALKIKSKFSGFDSERRFDIQLPEAKENRACLCGAVLRGVSSPEDCPLFGTGCTPENPIGSCMVSSEGACSAHYLYRRRGAQSK